jgi:hypothetical protein
MQQSIAPHPDMAASDPSERERVLDRVCLSTPPARPKPPSHGEDSAVAGRIPAERMC